MESVVFSVVRSVFARREKSMGLGLKTFVDIEKGLKSKTVGCWFTVDT